MELRVDVVCVGHDKLLLQTRALILEPHFRVEIATTLKSLANVGRERSIALAVLCHSLSWRERFLATEIVRQTWPAACVIEVASSLQSTTAGQDNQMFLGLDGPQLFLDAVCRILGMPVPTTRTLNSRLFSSAPGKHA